MTAYRRQYFQRCPSKNFPTPVLLYQSSIDSRIFPIPINTAISTNSPRPITNNHAAPFINVMNIGLATRFAVFCFPAVLDQQFDVENAGCLGSIGLTPDDFHEFDIPHVVSEKDPVSCANSRTGCERPDLFRITGKVAHGVFGERRLIKQQGRDAVSRLLYAVNLGFNMSQACIRRRTGDHCDQKAVFQGFHPVKDTTGGYLSDSEQIPIFFLAQKHECPNIGGRIPVFGHRFRGFLRLAVGELTGRLQTSGDPRWIQCEGVPQYNAPAGTHGTCPTKPAMVFWHHFLVVDVAKVRTIRTQSRFLARVCARFADLPLYRGDLAWGEQGGDARPAVGYSRWFARECQGVLQQLSVGVRAMFRDIAAEWRPVYQSNLVPPSVLVAPVLPQAVQQQHGEGQGNHPQQVPDIPQQGQDGGMIDNAYRAGEIPALGWTVYHGGHRIRARDHVHNPTTTETFRKARRLVTSNPSYNAAMMGAGAAPVLAFRRRPVSAVRGNGGRFRVPVLVDLNAPANAERALNDQGADLHPFRKGQWRYTSVQNRRQVSFAHAHTSAFHKYAQRSMPKSAPMETQWIQGPTHTAAAVTAIARFRYTRIPATVRTNRCPAMGWCA